MANPNFGAILDRPTNTIQRPKSLPQGNYLFVTQGMPKQDKSAKKGTEFVEFACKPLQPYDDVDAEALQEMGGLGEVTSMPLTFYLTEKSAYRLVEFMRDDLGIDDENGERNPRAMLTETPGQQFVGFVKHTPSDDGKSVYANIATTAPVES